ncbi:octapeptide-repeat protein T2-like [Pleurodeles waltl]|uniref:octapeptide-repeat protein T2-like n=1 Tax=Pleurodeles waltl TaxID=8319 RepID=UPI0037094CC5
MSQGKCRRAAPQESGSWRSSASLQPRRHGDAWGRRRKSAPEFRVADTEEGLRATGRGGSAGRDQEAEEETGKKSEEERDAETEHQDEIGRSAESEREGEARRSANPGHQGNEEEEKSEEPHREETEDATACHGPGGSWLDKVRHIPGARQCPADFLSRCPDSSGLYQSRSWEGVCRRAAPQESGSWRSSASLQPRRHGDAWGRRRKSAPEFRVADTEEGLRATGRGGSAGRDQEAEEETRKKSEEERDAETEHQDEIGRSAESEREGEARRSANPGHQGNEEEEKSEEPHREETEDATACHGPGGSWLDKDGSNVAEKVSS